MKKAKAKKGFVPFGKKEDMKQDKMMGKGKKGKKGK